MTYAITRSCCNDASCIEVCPVDCIHPTPGEPGFAEAEMLYIAPDDCVDCGACVEACPVSAIYPDHELPTDLSHFVLSNGDFFSWVQQGSATAAVQTPARVESPRELRVAVVGSGPSAWYLVDSLLQRRGLTVSITVFERLQTPHGLARFGVAPDHRDTRDVIRLFESWGRDRRVQLKLGVEVGRDVTHQDLLEDYDAIVYATGAALGRRLGIPGEELAGSVSSADFVGWYNGHPDHEAQDFELSHERAVIVGNGNVALDMARLLVSSAEDLARAEISAEVRQALESSAVREVVVLGRRGPEHAAFTSAEFRALLACDSFDVVMRAEDAAIATADAEKSEERSPATFAALQRAAAMSAAAERTPDDSKPRIVFRFGASPGRLLGTEKVEGVVLAGRDAVDGEVIPAGLVLSAIGYRSQAVGGIPLREQGNVRNQDGRVIGDDGVPLERTYVVGWAKRGPSGTIGSNRACSAQTAACLVEDFLADHVSRSALQSMAVS